MLRVRRGGRGGCREEVAEGVGSRGREWVQNGMVQRGSGAEGEGAEGTGVQEEEIEEKKPLQLQPSAQAQQCQKRVPEFVLGAVAVANLAAL